MSPQRNLVASWISFVVHAQTDWPEREMAALTSENHSFDLFERRKGWKAEDVLVVTPYVERVFFQRLVMGLRPRRMSVIIDDGCRIGDVDMVRETVAKVGGSLTKALACVLGSANGLMHLKLFYIVWKTPGKRTARTLIFGSANATRQGFGGTTNAELIVSTTLTKVQHAEAIAWCEAAIAAARSKTQARVPAARDLELGRGIRLRLPALNIGRKKSAAGSFDLWVQRGWLLSEYRHDPGFLKIPISLSRGLSQTEQERLVAESGFLVPAKKHLTFPYALPDGQSAQDEAEEGDEIGNWRRKFFVWTQLGEWCSAETYSAEHHKFRKKNYEWREARLRCLEMMRSPSVRDAERLRFLGSMNKLWTDLGDEANELLQGEEALDEQHYSELFYKRVDRDLLLVAEEEFRIRYLRGFELSQVPRFRPDVRGWRDFIDSLVRQLCLEQARTRSQSRLFHAISDAVDSIGSSESVFEDQGKLRKILQFIFESCESGDQGAAKAKKLIVEYHCD